MPATTTFFLEAAWKATALLGAAWVAVLFLRKKSAATRHQIWTVSLAAVLILPLFSTLLPALRVPIRSSLLPDGFLFHAQSRMADQHSPAQRLTGASPFTSGPDLGRIFATLWVLGAALSLAQMFIGWAAVERMRRKTKPLTLPDIDASVEVREAQAGSMPITYGLFRPIIFIPADANEWTAERRRVVLLHELAHVHRKDGVTHLLARIVLALYWWHPLVWTAWRESIKERERAADDLVLNAGAGASEYAGHLLDIARAMQTTPAGAPAMVHRSQLSDRLAAILDSNRDRQAPRRTFVVAAALITVAILVPVAAMRARNSAPQAATLSSDAAADLINQGKLALSAKNYETAIHFFERAQTDDPEKSAEAKMWMAITQQRQNNFETADALYQSALSVELPNTPSAATISELYAAMLREQNKEEDATKVANQAAGMRKIQGEQAVATSAPPSPDLHRMGGDVQPPKLLSKVEPEYSEDARLAKYSGSVLLSIEILEDGSPHNIKVTRPLGFGLDQKAVEAVAKWKFEPATLNGQPVAVSAQVEVNFRLQ